MLLLTELTLSLFLCTFSKQHTYQHRLLSPEVRALASVCRGFCTFLCKPWNWISARLRPRETTILYTGRSCSIGGKSGRLYYGPLSPEVAQIGGAKRVFKRVFKFFVVSLSAQAARFFLKNVSDSVYCKLCRGIHAGCGK